MDRFLQDVCFNVTDSSYELVLPSWCKETNGDYDQVAYLVVDKRKKDEDSIIGLYVSEFDAWNKVHDLIAQEDLECVEPPPIYYVRLFKLTVENVMPFGEGMYVKYKYEKMKFDI